jgi:hypothetical protein
MPCFLPWEEFGIIESSHGSKSTTTLHLLMSPSFRYFLWEYVTAAGIDKPYLSQRGMRCAACYMDWHMYRRACYSAVS